MSDGLVEAEFVLPVVAVGDDGADGSVVSGFNGDVVVSGDGVGSGVCVALLGRVPEVPLATRGV